MTTDQTNTTAGWTVKELKAEFDKIYEEGTTYGGGYTYPYYHQCPRCGYCPHCGRGGPYWPTYPWPTYPRWEVTC